MDIKSITRNFHLVDSKEALAAHLQGWRYWDSSGEALWFVVNMLYDDLREELVDRHEESNAKRREANQRKRDGALYRLAYIISTMSGALIFDLP